MYGVGRYTHRVTIQEKTGVTATADGPVTEWGDVETRWARVVLVSLDGRQKFQQLGHSSVTNRIHFQGRVEVELGQHRFKWRDEYYYPIEPPGEPSGMGLETIVAIGGGNDPPDIPS
jgi:head-tail adaptor